MEVDTPRGPVTDTFTGPAVSAGVTAVIVVADVTLKLVAGLEPNVTVVTPVNAVPVIVTVVPPLVVPVVGVKLVIAGAATLVIESDTTVSAGFEHANVPTVDVPSLIPTTVLESARTAFVDTLVTVLASIPSFSVPESAALTVAGVTAPVSVTGRPDLGIVVDVVGTFTVPVSLIATVVGVPSVIVPTILARTVIV